MKKTLELTNHYIILATPLILYVLISNIYMAATIGSGKIILMLFSLILLMLMGAAFLSGWFNMIKIAISESLRKEQPNSLIKEFPIGVGEYFLPMLGGLFIMLLFSSIIMVITYFIGINAIGEVSVTLDSILKASQNTTALRAFVAGLSTEDLMKINLWNILIFVSMTVTYYLLFLFLPAIFFKTKNPFIAFIKSLSDLFSKKILKTSALFLIIFVINFFISLFSALFGANLFMHFALTLFNFYFITAASVGVFLYYKENFVENLLGKNVDVKI